MGQTMTADEVKQAEEFAAYMRGRTEAKTAAAARAAVLAGPRAGELLELESKAEICRLRMHDCMQLAGIERRTLFEWEQHDFDAASEQRDDLLQQIRALVRKARPD